MGDKQLFLGGVAIPRVGRPKRVKQRGLEGATGARWGSSRGRTCLDPQARLPRTARFPAGGSGVWCWREEAAADGGGTAASLPPSGEATPPPPQQPARPVRAPAPSPASGGALACAPGTSGYARAGGGAARAGGGAARTSARYSGVGAVPETRGGPGLAPERGGRRLPSSQGGGGPAGLWRTRFSSGAPGGKQSVWTELVGLNILNLSGEKQCVVEKSNGLSYLLSLEDDRQPKCLWVTQASGNVFYSYCVPGAVSITFHELTNNPLLRSHRWAHLSVRKQTQ